MFAYTHVKSEFCLVYVTRLMKCYKQSQKYVRGGGKIWEFLLQMALTHCHDVVAQI